MLDKLKIGQRVSLGLSFVVLLMVTLGAVSVLNLRRMQQDFARVEADSSDATRRMAVMRAEVLRQAVLVRDLTIYEDLTVQRAVKKDLKGSQAKLRQASNELVNQAEQFSPQLRALLQEAGKQQASIQATLQDALTALDNAEFDESKDKVFNVLRPKQFELNTLLDQAASALTSETNRTIDEAKQRVERLVLTLIIAIVVGVVVTGAMGLVLVRSIVSPLHVAVDAARRIAEGDLTVQFASRTADETGQLLTALGDMVVGLQGIVHNVRAGTAAIALGSEEIARGNLDLSARTEQQATSLEETASSMEELTGSVKQNAENARHANELATSTADIAVVGGNAVAEVVETMTAINNSAKKIADITSVIDSIAFQTNILALNAAVEAARAGEQGRGFAVVASEVRSLAQRSATASKEISDLIAHSVAQVEAGTRMVDNAGTKMHDIVGSVKQLKTVIGEIAVLSQEQSSGIEQINHALTLMDDVTQKNASLVEEAAAAAASLQDQAVSLEKLVATFRLHDDTRQPEVRRNAPVTSLRLSV